MTIANAAVEAGADVFCCDILAAPSQPEWEALQGKAAKYSVKVSYRRLDITDVEGVHQCFGEIAQASRRTITGFVSCAAVQDEQPAIDYNMEKFRSVLRINVDGTMATAQAAARLMRDSGKGGSIVLVASISGSVVNRVSSERGSAWAER